MDANDFDLKLVLKQIAALRLYAGVLESAVKDYVYDFTVFDVREFDAIGWLIMRQMDEVKPLVQKLVDLSK